MKNKFFGLLVFAVFLCGSFQCPTESFGRDTLWVEIRGAYTKDNDGISTLYTLDDWVITLEGNDVDETFRRIMSAKIVIERENGVGWTDTGERIVEWVPVDNFTIDIEPQNCPCAEAGMARTEINVRFTHATIRAVLEVHAQVWSEQESRWVDQYLRDVSDEYEVAPFIEGDLEFDILENAPLPDAFFDW